MEIPPRIYRRSYHRRGYRDQPYQQKRMAGVLGGFGAVIFGFALLPIVLIVIVGIVYVILSLTQGFLQMFL